MNARGTHLSIEKQRAHVESPTPRAIIWHRNASGTPALCPWSKHEGPETQEVSS